MVTQTVPDLVFTNHARWRMCGREISRRQIEIALTYGTRSTPDEENAVKYTMDFDACNRMAADSASADAYDHFGVTVVLKDGYVVITVCWKNQLAE